MDEFIEVIVEDAGQIVVVEVGDIASGSGGGGGAWDRLLTAPDAGQWLLGVDNDGNLTTTKQ
jgi:hypothetical protein